MSTPAPNPVPRPVSDPMRDPVIAGVVEILRVVPGVKVVGIGGSRSLGLADPQSDYDFVVFEQNPGDILDKDVAAVVEKAVGAAPKIAKDLALVEFEYRGHKVEVLFRRLSTIAHEIEAAKKGEFKRVLHPLHPAGYISTALIAHLLNTRALWDPEGNLAALAKTALPYPESLRTRMMQTFQSEAGMGLIHASKVRRPNDLPYLTALYGRVTAAWLLFLFAVNRRYPVIDKGGMRLVMTFPVVPPQLHARTVKIFRDAAAGNLDAAKHEAWTIQREIVAIGANTAAPAS